MSDNNTALKEWIQRGESIFVPSTQVVVKKIVPAGLYSIKYSEALGFYLFKETFFNDEILVLPEDTISTVMTDINKFWDRGDKFKEYGLAHKRGVLLYGKAGTGKSCLINILINQLINDLNGVVFTIKNHVDLETYISFLPEFFRTIEPNRPIVTILEDIDGLIEYSSNAETMLLNVLDGLEQMEKIVYVATTNYTEKLKQRILNRPSRFDLRVEIKPPTAEIRKYYFLNKLKPQDIKDNDIDKWVKLSDGFTMAHLREMVVSIVVLGNDLESTIKKLRELEEIPQSHNYGKDTSKGIGFTTNAVKIYSDEPISNRLNVGWKQ